MALPNIFSKEVSETVIQRIHLLSHETPAQWGKMNVGQMLAHCNVSYEMVYDTIHSKPSGFMKFVLKSLVKSKVVNETPYQQNSRTAPQFLITTEKDFHHEKSRLVSYIEQTQGLGIEHFENKESHSFGKLKSQEWNNMFYKHLDHHLTQFGV